MCPGIMRERLSCLQPAGCKKYYTKNWKMSAVSTTDWWLKLNFASCMIRQTRSLGALALCSICNIVVFTWNRSFYPTTSAVPSVSFLILHPRETQIMWSQTETEKNFTLNRSFFLPKDISSTPSVLPDSPSLRDTNSVVTDSETEKNQTSLKNQGRQIKC